MQRQKLRSHPKKIWASQWSVARQTFYRQILSLLYSSFFFWNFRPRLARELLVALIFLDDKNSWSGKTFKFENFGLIMQDICLIFLTFSWTKGKTANGPTMQRFHCHHGLCFCFPWANRLEAFEYWTACIGVSCSKFQWASPWQSAALSPLVMCFEITCLPPSKRHTVISARLCVGRPKMFFWTSLSGGVTPLDQDAPFFLYDYIL